MKVCVTGLHTAMGAHSPIALLWFWAMSHGSLTISKHLKGSKHTFQACVSDLKGLLKDLLSYPLKVNHLLIFVIPLSKNFALQFGLQMKSNY